jgi:predicted dehydrogenase
MSQPLKIGSIGAGGYAAALIKHFDKSVPADRGRIAAVTTSRPESVKQMPEIQNQNADAVTSVPALLEVGLDGVIVPTSIESHLPYTRQVLEAGCHVFCEKPITATIEDAYEMIRLRDEADKVVAVGYQDTYSASVQWAKKQILEGRIGKIRHVRLWATWPRPDSYYQRNNWAAKVKIDGRWVLDSPANNALAHQINLALYITGATADDSNVPTAIEAELYRARDIENYDTCAMRFDTELGCPVLVLLTHACRDNNQPLIEYVGESGIIRRVHPHHCELEIDGKVVESQDDGEQGAHTPMLLNWLDAIEGKAPRVKCEIENALEVTKVINGASEATPVYTVDEANIDRVPANPDKSDDKLNAIRDIEATFKRCFDAMKLPSELGDIAWAKPAGRMDLTDYRQFGGLATA